MDEIFNRMQLGPLPAEPPEDVRTLSEKLSKSRQEVLELRRKIQILEELQKVEKNPEARQKEEEALRRERLQLLHTQMYGEERQLFEDYGELGAGANNDQQPPEVGPDEFISVDEFLLDDGPRPLVQQDHFSTLDHQNNMAPGDLRDLETSNRCEACGSELACVGATNFEDNTCPTCDQLRANKLDLKGIVIPKPGRGEHMHRMHEYGSDPLQVESTSSRSDSRMSSPEHCSFCHGILPPGSGRSHLSSCPEYHRWSGTGSNDSFFYYSWRFLKKGKCSQSSPQLINAKFSAD